MSIAERRGKGLESTMDSLSIEPKSKSKPAGKEPVADSWDDEDANSSGEDTETEGPSMKNTLPGPPPPTPVTPGYKHGQESVDFEDPYAVNDPSSRSGGRGSGSVDGKRQEKQTATASRLIAGALGVRAPKRTEEQRAYDKAVREKEQKKKDQEREDRKKAEQNKEKAKASVWDD